MCHVGLIGNVIKSSMINPRLQRREMRAKHLTYLAEVSGRGLTNDAMSFKIEMPLSLVCMC
jgi:hypothetical protein